MVIRDQKTILNTYFVKKSGFIWQFSENAVILHPYSREALLFTPTVWGMV